MEKRFFLIRIVGLAVSCLLVMLLWNWLIPSIFGFKYINFLQATGLLLLCRILFGRLGWGKPMNERMRKNPIKEKWMNMSQDEREEFIQKMKKNRPFRKEHFFGRKKFSNDDRHTNND